MTIGWAIIISTMLYLLYKVGILTSRKFWRRTSQIVLVLGVFGFLIAVALYGWSRYSDWQEAKREATADAAQQAQEAKCVARFKSATTGMWDVMDETVAENTCVDSSAAVAVDLNVPASIPVSVVAVSKPQTRHERAFISDAFSPELRKRCYFEASGGDYSEACGYGSSDIAALHAGDRVEIRSNKVRAANGDDIYEVKFHQWTGWIPAADLETAEQKEQSAPVAPAADALVAAREKAAQEEAAQEKTHRKEQEGIAQQESHERIKPSEVKDWCANHPDQTVLVDTVSGTVTWTCSEY